MVFETAFGHLHSGTSGGYNIRGLTRHCTTEDRKHGTQVRIKRRRPGQRGGLHRPFGSFGKDVRSRPSHEVDQECGRTTPTDHDAPHWRWRNASIGSSIFKLTNSMWPATVGADRYDPNRGPLSRWSMYCGGETKHISSHPASAIRRLCRRGQEVEHQAGLTALPFSGMPIGYNLPIFEIEAR